MSMDLSTDEIVKRIRGGDADAFRFIVARYQGEVAKVVNAMLIDFDAREDVIQKVFIRAFQKLDQFQLGRGFEKWIKAIARNMVREELRKSYRYNARIDKYSELVEVRMDTETDPEELQEVTQALHECIENLDEPAAEGVRMRYLHRQSMPQVAQQLQRSPGAVRTLLYRARAHLRTCLENKGVFPS